MRDLVHRALLAAVLAGSVAACSTLPKPKFTEPNKPVTPGEKRLAAWSREFSKNCQSLKTELGLAYLDYRHPEVAQRARIVLQEFCLAPPQSDEQAVEAINRILEAMIALQREKLRERTREHRPR